LSAPEGTIISFDISLSLYLAGVKRAYAELHLGEELTLYEYRDGCYQRGVGKAGEQGHPEQVGSHQVLDYRYRARRVYYHCQEEVRC
jgi:hypothetical protein